jgi:hypothetical protein
MAELPAELKAIALTSRALHPEQFPGVAESLYVPHNRGQAAASAAATATTPPSPRQSPTPSFIFGYKSRAMRAVETAQVFEIPTHKCHISVTKLRRKLNLVTYM